MKNLLSATFSFCLLLGCFTTEILYGQDNPIRILYGGIAHESNTFIPYLTEKEDFIQIRGNDKAYLGNLWQSLPGKNVEFIFTLVADADPYGVVSRDAYESFRDEILEGAKNAGPLDGVMLQMHGALHVEGYEDAQVDFIRSLRKIVGEEVIISGSFDLHGNMSEVFVSELNILTAYRTAPHVDGRETVQRALRLLIDAIEKKQQPVIAHINVPILIPGEKGITSVEPLKSLYSQLPGISSREGLMDASIFVGMPWTDVWRAGMSVQVVAENPSYLEAARQEATRLAGQIWDRRRELKFDVPTDDIDGALRTALAAPESTVFITDSGDNTTAGAVGDGTLVLQKLLENRVKDAVFAGIYDPEAVKACEEAEVGGIVHLDVGGKRDTVFSKPLEIIGLVKFITQEINLKDTGRRPAVVDIDGISLVLLNQRRSFISPEDFKEVGIDPLANKIVIVKLGYLFQGLRDIAPRTIMALTPGFANQVIESLPYHQIRRPIYPLDPDMEWEPSY
jgi:microcystin degradation protein MlrC